MTFGLPSSNSRRDSCMQTSVIPVGPIQQPRLSLQSPYEITGNSNDYLSLCYPVQIASLFLVMTSEQFVFGKCCLNINTVFPFCFVLLPVPSCLYLCKQGKGTNCFQLRLFSFETMLHISLLPSCLHEQTCTDSAFLLYFKSPHLSRQEALLALVSNHRSI